MVSISESPGRRLSDTAYDEIRRLIVTLELAPRAVVDERALVAQLGIGRTPVREALRRLAQERLVEVYPRRGMFVTDVDARELTRLNEVRVVLEPEAAQRAAERATDREREELAALLVELDGRARTQPEMMEFDERIHRTIYRLAHNPFLQATLEQYYTHVVRIWYLGIERAIKEKEATDEHHSVLQAIRDRTAQRAKEALRIHIERAFEETMLRVLEAL
jgi:DNA-binding GntR family transcriptional regulator